MLAYAANRPVAGKRESSPNALLLVISVHVALLALAMSAKMDFPRKIARTPPLINIHVTTPPVARTHAQALQPHAKKMWDDRPSHEVKIAEPPLEVPSVNSAATTDPSPTSVEPTIALTSSQGPTADLTRRDARLITPMSELKPPYPAAKLASEEEATLHLRLTIDQGGRVTAVDPVGYADREFLETARRYIIAHWRYQPASEAGLAISSTITVTLRFQLNS